MALENTYNKTQNTSINDKTLQTNYEANFTTTTANISAAHALITAQAKKHLVLIAEKLNDVCASLTTLQQYWFNAITQFLTYLGRLGTAATTFDSTKTYQIGDIAIYDNIYYMCIAADTTGAWDVTKWKMITPNSLGIDWQTDITKTDSNGVVMFKYNNEVVAYVLPSLSFVTADNDAVNGMVYVLEDTQ